MKALAAVRTTIIRLVKQWRTVVELRGKDESFRIPVSFKWGIFQGDTLSQLLAMGPLSWVQQPISKL